MKSRVRFSFKFDSSSKHKTLVQELLDCTREQLPDKDVQAQHSSSGEKHEKRGHNAGTKLLFLSLLVWFYFRSAEALPGFCDRKLRGGVVDPEAMKNQCHSCPTLHLAWGTDTMSQVNSPPCCLKARTFFMDSIFKIAFNDDIIHMMMQTECDLFWSCIKQFLII